MRQVWYRVLFWIALSAPAVGALLCWPHLVPMSWPLAADLENLVIIPAWVLGTAAQIVSVYLPWHFFGAVAALVVLGVSLRRRDRVYSWGAGVLSLLLVVDLAVCLIGESRAPVLLDVVSRFAGR